MRQAVKERKTLETAVSVSIGLDGSGKADIATGVGFFDHMLTLLAKHGFLDLQVKAQGDLQVDCHHTVEDCGITGNNRVAANKSDRFINTVQVSHPIINNDYLRTHKAPLLLITP